MNNTVSYFNVELPHNNRFLTLEAVSLVRMKPSAGNDSLAVSI